MNPLVDAVRWFNRAAAWNQLKPSLAKRIARRLDRAAGPRLYEHVQGDLTLRLDLARNIDLHIYLHVYQVTELQVLRRVLRAGDVFIDGGANIGLFSLLASRRVGPAGKVFAFEPSARALTRLEEHLSRNHADNVTLHRAALWSSPGTATFHDPEGPSDSQGSLGSQSGAARQTTVPTLRMDDVVTGPVRLLKLDVEGAEWEALRGAQRLITAAPRPHLLVELNAQSCRGFQYHPIDMIDWLLALRPGDRVHMLTSRRRRRVTRDQLADRLRARPDRYCNVWLEPSAP